MDWFLYTIAALCFVGIICSITSVGKPREPLAPGVAAVATTIDMCIMGLALWFALTN